MCGHGFLIRGLGGSRQSTYYHDHPANFNVGAFAHKSAHYRLKLLYRLKGHLKPFDGPLSVLRSRRCWAGNRKIPIKTALYLAAPSHLSANSSNEDGFICKAFDLNPFPDKDRESRTWLSEDSGPITSAQQLLDHAARFELSQPQAQSILEEVVAAVSRWSDVATSAVVGLQPHELKDFKPAFEGNIN
jgi:hypothetical protein